VEESIAVPYGLPFLPRILARTSKQAVSRTRIAGESPARHYSVAHNCSRRDRKRRLKWRRVSDLSQRRGKCSGKPFEQASIPRHGEGRALYAGYISYGDS